MGSGAMHDSEGHPHPRSQARPQYKPRLLPRGARPPGFSCSLVTPHPDEAADAVRCALRLGRRSSQLTTPLVCTSVSFLPSAAPARTLRRAACGRVRVQSQPGVEMLVKPYARLQERGVFQCCDDRLQPRCSLEAPSAPSSAFGAILMARDWRAPPSAPPGFVAPCQRRWARGRRRLSFALDDDGDMAMLDHKSERPAAKPLKQDLSGWAAIEDYLQRADGGKVKDYADDIDTLLVFAGLFSAVLTAFVVESYTMLQEDTGQTTNQLLGTISSQLVNGSAASAAATASSSANFVPSAAARWINILFFLSLVFSLAAALFGILAKQWLREYMQWNSTLGVPRENVLIRQLRFEAFEDWHVSATISSIPALLELAMIMFLVGLVIMLWTLDTVVAVVITVATAVFLGIVSAFTVLPVIFKHCPYKSPTAWACYVLWNLLIDTIFYCARFCAEYARNIYGGWWQLSVVDLQWPKRPQNWRQREELMSISWKLRVPHNLYQGIQHALTAEKAGLNEDGTIGMLPNPTFTPVSSPKAALKDMFEVSVLFRALSWVYQASQDQRIREHVMHSMETIHSPQPENLDACGIPNVSDWCILWALQTDNLRRPQLALTDADEPGVTAVQRKIRDMWHSETTEIQGRQCVVSRTRQRIQYGSINLGVPPEYAPLLVDLVAADLKAAVADLRAAPVSRLKGPEVSVAQARTILELLCVMGCLCTSRALPLQDFHLQGIRSLVCENSTRRLVDHLMPGLRSSAMMLACRVADVQCRNGQLDVVARSEPMNAHDYGALICDYYAGDMARYVPEDLHVFVLLCNEWLLLVDRRMDSDATLAYVPVIVNKMADVAEFTLRERVANCGCFFHLPWVAQSWNVRAGHFQGAAIDAETLRAYLRLFHALERLQAQGLITGPDQESLPRLVGLVHSGFSGVCVDTQCSYTGLSSQASTVADSPEQSTQISAAALSLHRAAFQASSTLPYVP